MTATLSAPINASLATTPEALPLRDYQREAIDAVLAGFDDNIRRPLVALPTGTGKTVVFSHLLRERGGRGLVLVHRDELVQQTIEKMGTIMPGVEVGVVKAERDEHDRQITVASVQTLARRARLERLVPDYRTVVVDEGHHALARTWRTTLEYLRAFEADGPLVVGFTATPERGDQGDLGTIYERIVFQRDLLDMIAGGWLADMRAIAIKLRADLNKLHVRNGDFVDHEVEELLLETGAPEDVAAAYLAHMAGRKTLLFTPTVKVAQAMAAALRRVGVASEAISGGTPDDERRACLARLKTGETMVVANCAILTEGFDEPSVDGVIIARPTRTRPVYIQMVGRGTRLHPGKADLLVMDMVGATQRLDIFTATRLFGLPPETLGTASLMEVLEARIAAGQPRLEGTLVAAQVDLFARRNLHWLRAEHIWLLSSGEGMLTLEPEDDGIDRWRVVHIPRFGPQRVLRGGLTLAYAQGLAEGEARHAAQVLNQRDARWRHDPMTDRQRLALQKWQLEATPGMTKGEAADAMNVAIARSALSRRSWQPVVQGAEAAPDVRAPARAQPEDASLVLRCARCAHAGRPLVYSQSPHVRADCARCGRFLQFVKQSSPLAALVGRSPLDAVPEIFHAGQRFRHPEHGVGVIEAVQVDLLLVRFERFNHITGVDARYADLEPGSDGVGVYVESARLRAEPLATKDV